MNPTVYTFTNLINACVRCGEIEQAKQFLVQMKEEGITPNEVSITHIHSIEL